MGGTTGEATAIATVATTAAGITAGTADEGMVRRSRRRREGGVR
jgi:hypothetical protein